jgi:hypothetical protein
MIRKLKRAYKVLKSLLYDDPWYLMIVLNGDDE